MTPPAAPSAPSAPEADRAAARGQRRRRWRHSIKGRLVALFLLLALATGVVFLGGLQRVLAGGWQGYAKPIVADYLDRLAREIGSPPDPARAAAIAARLPVTVRIDGPQVRWRSDAERASTDHVDGRGRAASRDGSEWNERLDDWGLVRTTADGHRITFGLREPPPGLRPRLFGWVTLALLLALTAVAYLAVRRMLRPIEDIGAGVEAYGRGEFAHPIAVRRGDELGDLAARINTMAARLHAMLEAKRALLLAISHELRSPLTRARVNAELVPEGRERDALLRDLAEMRDLVTSLLESERLAQGHAALQAEPVDLARWTREVVAELDAAGTDGADTAVATAIDDPGAPVAVDPARLRLLVRNLVDNARRHGAGAAVAPFVFLRREVDGRLALGVRDHGPGVPADEIARLAQAFYRPDRARTREAGGVGLGLYLCRLVAEAHGGELRVTPAQPGLEVAMVWSPRSAVGR